MKKLLALFIVVLFCQDVYSQIQEVTIPGSQVRTITSSIVKGQEYELHILLPGNYSKSTKKYPVVYLMDSQWDFPLVKSLYGQHYYDGFIPEMIIVGVTWGGIRPNADSLRARDYTPTNEKRLPQSGGADNFLSFMKNELFPFIESNYRAESNNRTLIGCSLGGLITLYALFTQPDLFHGYVAASPAFGWDREVIYQYEKKYFESNYSKPQRLYMTMGDVERSTPAFNRFAKHLDGRHYSALKIKSKVLENTGHSGTKGEGFARGLQYVFERNNITPDQSLLNKYAGVYTLPNGNTAELKSENSKLVLYLNPNNRYELCAESDTDFYSTAEFLNIHFNSPNDFQLNRYNNSQSATKKK